MRDRIEICGAIASGKSSLATAFSQLSRNIVYEDFSKISFLDDFYFDPVSYAFETEIAFTLQHYYQLKKAVCTEECVISDFSLAGDFAYARVTLTDVQLPIYEKLFMYILGQLRKPCKLIRLKAPTNILLERMGKRSRENEQSISEDYLIKLEDSIDYTLKNVYTDVPVVEVKTDSIALDDYTENYLRSLYVINTVIE